MAAQLGTAAIRLAMATVASGPLLVGVLMVVEFVNGVLMPLFNVNLMSLRQASVGLDQQGRINATVGVVLWGATPVGALLAGLIGDAVGLRPVLVRAAVATAAASLLLVHVPRRPHDIPMPSEPVPPCVSREGAGA